MTNKTLIRAMMESSVWFRHWPATRIDKLLEYSRLQHHEKKQIIYSDDQRNQLVYLAHGTAWTSLLQNDPRLKFGLLFPGSVMGISRVLHPELTDSAFQFEAAQFCVTLEIPGNLFIDVVGAHPTLWRQVADAAVLYHRQCIKLALGVHTGAIRHRVILAIHHFCLQHEPLKLQVQAMQVDLSQWDLASLIQSTRPYVNRALKEMEQEGLVAVGYKKIEVLDLPRLRSIAESLGSTPA
nr:Crp/Fnr family transcriptional regulator [Herbaspirillum sp. B39]